MTNMYNDFENRVLERLNSGKSVQDFLTHAVFLLSEALNILVVQIFRKDDYAVKYAIDPLFTGNGPLSELHIQLKLIYALGVIERSEYEDAEYLLALYEESKEKKAYYQFTDEEVIAVCKQLNCVKTMPTYSEILIANHAEDEVFALLQQKRIRQMIKSTLVLSITTLLNNLSNKPAQNISPLSAI